MKNNNVNSIISLEEDRAEGYFEHLDPFLAIILACNNASQVIGLKNQYPLAVQEIAKLPYTNCRAFTWFTLEQEHVIRMAYALLCHAKESTSLRQVIHALLKKEFGAIDRACAALKQVGKISYKEVVKLSVNVAKVKTSDSNLEILVALSVIEYFTQQHGLAYLKSDKIELHRQMVRYYEQIFLLSHSVRGYNTSSERVDEKLLKQVRLQVKPYIQGYEAHLKQDVLKAIQQKLETYQLTPDTNHFQLAIYRQFGQDIQSLLGQYPLTWMDVEQLFAILIEMKRSGQRDPLSVAEFCDYLDSHLIQVALEYIHAKSYAYDRDYFFKMQASTDDQLTQSLQQEIKKIQKIAQTLEEQNVRLIENQQQLKEQSLKSIQEQTKGLNQDLAISNQENRRLIKQIESLELQLEEFKTRESELEEWMTLTESEVDLEDAQSQWIEYFNTPETLIVGCHPRTIHRLKRLLPEAKFFELDISVQDQFFIGVKQVFVCLHQVNHGMMYKLEKCCAEAPRYAMRKTNANLIIREMAESVGLLTPLAT